MQKGKTKFTYLIGTTLGRLKVLDLYIKYNKDNIRPYCYMIKCLCSCGTYKDFIITNIIRSPCPSCGCDKTRYDKMRGKNSPFYKGYEDISSKYFKNLKGNAKRRNIKFNLTIKDLWDKYIEQNKKCALSNLDIAWHDKSKLCSVDRRDSKKGYTIDNIQIVHNDVNRMKLEYPQDYFITLCKLIGENHARPHNTRKCA